VGEKRIYVIIAETVQNPLVMKYVHGKHFVMVPTADTKTIVQPKGRIGIQIGHVASRMRMHLMLASLQLALDKRGGTIVPEVTDDLKAMADDAITSIALAVPDSYRLEFREHLIRKTGVEVYTFYDENPEYGLGSVKTAICTAPVERHKLRDTLDYLELWRDS
jgi:hypothetical protein